MEKNLNDIKNIGVPINAELHKKMRIYLIKKDKTIKDYIPELIAKDLKNKNIKV